MRDACGQPWPMWTIPVSIPRAPPNGGRSEREDCDIVMRYATLSASTRGTASDEARGSYCSRPRAPERNSFSSARRGARSLSCGEPVCAEFPGHGPLDNALAGNSNCQCVPATRDANISAAYTMTRENFTPMNLPPRASSSGCPRALDRVATPARLVVCPASGPSRRSLAR